MSTACVHGRDDMEATVVCMCRPTTMGAVRLRVENGNALGESSALVRDRPGFVVEVDHRARVRSER